MAEVRESDRIAGVYRVEPTVHGDERGLFVETYRREWIPGAREMIQSNRSNKQAGALVGLHYHLHQSDYWYAPVGTIRVVLHDLREGGPTDGATESFEISGDDHHGVYIPPGVAHGFGALTDAVLTYLVDNYYNPADELGVAWDDPDVGADWGLVDRGLDPVMSERDRVNPRRVDLPANRRPYWPMRT
ncbi:MAG: dTDP-4-dehydrorhamnose 3,5-epimerase [Ilumatobacteraceae bacterium]